MGRIIVRKKKEIKNPYEIPGLQIKVYTPEELVYVYYKNLPRLEGAIMESALIDWLRVCGKEKLADALEDYPGKGEEALADFVTTIFSGISFYSKEEIQEASKALGEWSQTDPYARKKEKLDYLMDKGKIREAIEGYEGLAENGVNMAEDLLGSVYHNLGVAYAKLFLFEEAAKYFRIAWEKTGAPDSKEAYMLSLRMYLPKESYVNRIVEEGLGEEVAVELEEKILERLKYEEDSEARQRFQEIVKQKKLGNQAYFISSLQEFVEDMKRTWRNSYGDF